MAENDEQERIAALVSIGQLPSRYAFAVDARDLDALVALYVDDVSRPDVEGSGREPLRRHFERVLRAYYRTMHQIVGHQIDLVDVDHATGRVYCRAEHEIGDDWLVAALCYFDEYERRGGVWYFARRTIRLLYRYRPANRPTAPFVGEEETPSLITIPGSWPSWGAFWSRVDPVEVSRLTRQPVP
jgi:ketosteroid isomerase-like protein